MNPLPVFTEIQDVWFYLPEVFSLFPSLSSFFPSSLPSFLPPSLAPPFLPSSLFLLSFLPFFFPSRGEGGKGEKRMGKGTKHRPFPCRDWPPYPMIAVLRNPLGLVESDSLSLIQSRAWLGLSSRRGLRDFPRRSQEGPHVVMTWPVCSQNTEGAKAGMLCWETPGAGVSLLWNFTAGPRSSLRGSWSPAARPGEDEQSIC